MNDRHLEWLTDDDLLLLDGLTKNTELQTKIDFLKISRDSGKEAAFIEKVIREGRAKGKIRFKIERAVSCEICDKSSHIETYSAGRRRGEYKYSKCKLLRGVSFAEDFTVINGRPRLGVCVDCWDKIKDDLVARIKTEKFEYKSLLADCPYRKDDKRICFECGQDMYVSEMGKLPAMMSGTYPGECPHCGAKSLLFGKSHKVTSDFRIIEIAKEAT
jgi:uncharacterized protein YlaI